MSEDEKKNEGHKCCCCQCWKTIFIAIALLAIGAAIGHIMTMHHQRCGMMGCGDGYGMKACQERGERECEGSSECKAMSGKCQPGCKCPMCSKKAASSAEPNKAKCPMTDKKESESGKE
jgi:hypothetical protein